MEIRDLSKIARMYHDEYVQVRTDDGRLLGVVPTFGGDITSIFTKSGRTLSVGAVLMRAIHVPTGQDINPYDLYDFIPVPGLPNQTIDLRGVKRDDPDTGTPV